jgi:hypothetical protein
LAAVALEFGCLVSEFRSYLLDNHLSIDQSLELATLID